MLNLISPATGLLVFNTTENTYYYYTGSTWVPFLSSSSGWTTTGNSNMNVSTNFLGTTSNAPLAIRTNNTEWVRILSTGQVGIGVTGPSAKLEVGNGNFSLTNTNNTAGEARFFEPSTSGGNYSAFKAQAQSADITYTLPNIAPSAGQVLTAGVTPTTLQWSTPSGGSGLWSLGAGASSLVGSGLGNTAAGNYAISAGQNNSASGINSVAIGGYQNTASNNYTVVSGGQENTASGINSAVGGGYKNIASNNYSVVPGGQENEATGINSTVGGGYKNKATSQYAVVAGGESGLASGANSTVGGGYQSTASGQYSVVSGGQTNTASGSNTFIGGGGTNTASSQFGTISGGWGNQVTSSYSTIGGGQSNTASGAHSVVDGGLSNTASGQYSSVLGGQSNSTAAVHSTVLGGYQNSLSISATYSMVFGSGATVTQANTVAFSHTGNTTRVGIRNVAPTEALDVTGNIRFSGALMPNNNAGTSGYILRSAGAGSAPTWDNPSTLFWGVNGNTGTNASSNFVGTTDNIDLVFRTNNTEKFRIESGGDVGIGTTNPAFKLEVANGSVALSNTNNTAGTFRFYEPSSSGSNYTSFAAKSMVSNITYILPDTQGQAGDVLTNDGSGNLYWNNNLRTGALYLGPTTASTISVDQDNYYLDPNYTIFRISATSNTNITGFDGGSDGRIMIVINVSSPAKTITLNPQNSGSDAENRLITASGNVTLQVDESASFIYDGVSQRWRLYARNP